MSDSVAPIEELRGSFLLLPGFELDGFPRELPSSEAAKLLSGWVGLWHPLLIARMQCIPGWREASSLPAEPQGCVFVLPQIAEESETGLAEEYSQPSENASFRLIRPTEDWIEFQDSVLQICGLADGASEFHANRQSFAALGYAFLQIQLMTRQLRYTSNLDQSLFSSQVVAAAEAALDPNRNDAQDLLQACFDSLGEERDHYYSLDVCLLDITLLARSTLGKSLHRQLEQASRPSTLLLSAKVASQMHTRQPENFQLLRKRITSEECSLAGGLDSECPHPILPRHSLSHELAKAKKAYTGLGLVPPKVFGRLSFGLASDDVATLKSFGFEGVLLQAWTEGAYPEGSQSKLSWESNDGTFLPALGGSVIDAGDASSFLSLGWRAGEALDHQHVPTLVFAHWPDRVSPFCELLDVVTQHTPALGKWMTCDAYFQDTDDPYHQERLSPNGFKFNWLANAEHPSRLLENVKHITALYARLSGLRNLSNLLWQLQHQPKLRSENHAQGETEQNESESESVTPETHALIDYAPELLSWYSRLESLDLQCDNSLEYEQCQQAIGQVHDELLRQMTACLTEVDSASEEEVQARLVLNPRICAQRIRVQSPRDHVFAAEDWNYAAGRVGHDQYTCVDTPGMGFVVAPQTDKVAGRVKQQHLAELGGVVQNEFLEAQVDTSRGHLKSLHIPAKRGNRLSMLIARRDRNGEGGFDYSEMRATEVSMLTSSNMCGLVRATGHLEFGGQRAADFEIDYEIWRGSRILEVAIRLRNLTSLADSNPWKSGFVLRLAWPTEAAILRTYASGRRHNWTSGRAVAPELIEIDEADYCTQLLTGGLAFHRRTESRFLETILAADSVDCEHRIGIAVDLPHPQVAAEDFLDTRYARTLRGSKKLSSKHGWLVSSNARNVIVDLQFPLVNSSGDNTGIRIHVIETSGKSTNARLRFLYNLAKAERVDESGTVVGPLATKEDGFAIALRANEHCSIDVLWG